MTPPEIPRILILTDDPDDARRWADALAGPEFEVSTEPDSLPDPEVVLTDHDCSAWCFPKTEFVGRVSVGLTDGSEADVALPADASARELCLACGLLAQIVRLRRGQQAAARRREELERAVHIDPLTGLPNRRAWDEMLDRRLAESAVSGRPLVVALVDLDHFKSVNDRWGHTVGDQVLRQAGAALRDGLRQDDFVARLGGDEFALLLTGAPVALAETILDRVRRAVPRALEQLGQEPVTASIGFCTCVRPEDTVEDPLARASAALGHAKRAGRDRIKHRL
ncbi:MAG: GGDEF domain-containing protein [Pirellulales bacterium]|nr:GGDEF domain-containing protein [Pirellulales bacterium]